MRLKHSQSKTRDSYLAERQHIFPESNPVSESDDCFREIEENGAVAEVTRFATKAQDGIEASYRARLILQ